MSAGRSRAALAALGVVAASLVVGTALTAALSLSGGFSRAADRADLPDVIVRFAEEDRADADRALASLPNVETLRYRTELSHVGLSFGGHFSDVGAVQVVDPGRRGYEILSGRDARGPREVVVEQGVARSWGLGLGDVLGMGRVGEARVVGIARSPDNVAFPLAAVPRVYVDARFVPPEFGRLPVNVGLLWLSDRSRSQLTLSQARGVSYGLRNLRFVTRAGVQVLVGQAAGIVIALLVAFSLVAVATAAVMLGASARSEVARRLPSIGVQRAVGFSRARVVLLQARSAVAVAAPCAALGLFAGWLAVRGPAGSLLAALNEAGRGGSLAWWLLGAWAVIVAIVAAASAWPAWSATRAPIAALLRGGEMAAQRPPRTLRASGGLAPSRSSAAGGLASLGARLVSARRGRWATTVALLAAAASTLVLLLALASLLVALRDDPATVGKHYALTAAAGEDRVGDIERVKGVAAAAPRWTVNATAAFSLGQPLRIVAFPSGDESFEQPPLDEGSRRRAPDEVEVGRGLADSLGLSPGSRLAVALPNGSEVRYRVSGIVSAIENDGRVAYASSERLAALGVLNPPSIAVRLDGGAGRADVSRRLVAIGAPPARATAATTRNTAFLGLLATVLRVVALTVGLVCLAILAQTLVLTARERRPTLALLRTAGAGDRALSRVLGGACAAVLVPALVAGVLLEWLVLGPAVSSLAAGYAGLSLAPGPAHIALSAGGLGILGAIAVFAVGRRVSREPVVAGLREQA